MGPEKQSPKNTELYAKFSKKILGRKNRNFPDHWVKKTEHQNIILFTITYYLLLLFTRINLQLYDSPCNFLALHCTILKCTKCSTTDRTFRTFQQQGYSVGTEHSIAEHLEHAMFCVFRTVQKRPTELQNIRSPNFRNRPSKNFWFVLEYYSVMLIMS